MQKQTPGSKEKKKAGGKEGRKAGVGKSEGGKTVVVASGIYYIVLKV